MTDENAAISAKSVSKVFGSAPKEMRALDAVSVDIRRNEFFTLLGPSGCGKTTLLRMIAGFEAPTEGVILLDGADITAAPPFRRPVNTVFQSYALFPHLTVSENIAFGLQMLGRSRSDIEATLREMLALVRLEQMGGRLPSQLSGGQQQRVALARALAPRPSVLLLDEPLSALDLKLRQQMQIELKRMQRDTGITFVFVTHDQEEALTMSDRIGVMNGGRILQVGSPQEIYNRPVNRFVASFIGESNFLEAEIVESGRPARVRLAAGADVAAEAVADVPEGEALSGKVTVAVRPEQIVLDQASGVDGLAGKITNTQYFGTDLYCYIALDDGAELVARTPVSAGGEGLHSTGDIVRVGFAAGALRIVGG